MALLFLLASGAKSVTSRAGGNPMTMTRNLAVAVVAALAACAQAQAQTYPDKPVTLVIPFAAGGPTDVVARTIAQSLSTSMGQPFVVENKPYDYDRPILLRR